MNFTRLPAPLPHPCTMLKMADDCPRLHTLEDLLAVMARLRDPVAGCPWDVKQSFATIAPYTIEEAYEVADAIARESLDALREELGDLLLQVVYHAQMASEQKRFDFGDVVDAITRKMIRRHQHVFADPSLRDEFVNADLWQRIIAEEKAEWGTWGRITPRRCATGHPCSHARGEATEAYGGSRLRLAEPRAGFRKGRRGDCRVKSGNRLKRQRRGKAASEGNR